MKSPLIQPAPCAARWRARSTCRGNTAVALTFLQAGSRVVILILPIVTYFINMKMRPTDPDKPVPVMCLKIKLKRVSLADLLTSLAPKYQNM
jgi:hypothetical protein